MHLLIQKDAFPLPNAHCHTQLQPSLEGRKSFRNKVRPVPTLGVPSLLLGQLFLISLIFLPFSLDN
jgi:hypothetical protein